MSMGVADLKNLVDKSGLQENPIKELDRFLEKQSRYEESRLTEKWQFVGYVIELGYDTAKIITSDPYKIAVGGIPRGSYLIMVPNGTGSLPPHFTLLRVKGVTTTPLSNHVQQTYFELHKKSMPELDIWTQSELQWGALECDVLGMFYANPQKLSKLEFSGDVNNVVSAHRYKVFSPSKELLTMIVNGTLKRDNQFEIGDLRTMECQLTSDSSKQKDVPVKISMEDFKGCRTAMFGKTRLGKSNVVKLIAQGMLECTKDERVVGQLIFDINGEYANENSQDDVSLRKAYEDRCYVYALVERPGTPSEPLRLNFYEQPDSCIEILKTLLKQDNKGSNYITSFSSVGLPSIDDIQQKEFNKRTRDIRKVQMYWAILNKAGYPADEKRLKQLGLKSRNAKDFDPHFNDALRTDAYSIVRDEEPPVSPRTLAEMTRELEVISDFVKLDPNNKKLISKSSGNPIFDADDMALLNFLKPKSGSGPSVIRTYMEYHRADAGAFVDDILKLLDNGDTVILDLGNAADEIRRYFSDLLSRAVFSHQEKKFVTNTLGNSFIQLYFEEAHNLFPIDDKKVTGVYARFAKEGAKFHIGMVYSTQSPSTVNKELLIQTENFFVGHLSSQDETRALSKLQIAYSGIEEDIMRSRTPGYMRMLTLSHRFVVPVQAKLFTGELLDVSSV